MSALGSVYKPPNAPNLNVMRAQGFTRLGVFDLDESLFDAATTLGMKLDPTYKFDRDTIAWLKLHVAPYPTRMASLGIWSGPDEPNPTTLPVGSAAYNDVRDLFIYGKQQIPGLQTMITLSAWPAFSPAARWNDYAKPYYDLVDICGLDYFAWAWGGGNYGVYDMLIRNTIQYSGGKPCVMYQEGAQIDSAKIDVPTDWLVAAYNASHAAGAMAVNWFWTSLNASQWPLSQAAAQLIDVATSQLDLNHDGRVTIGDLVLAIRQGRGDLVWPITQAIFGASVLK